MPPLIAFFRLQMVTQTLLAFVLATRPLSFTRSDRYGLGSGVAGF